MENFSNIVMNAKPNPLPSGKPQSLGSKLHFLKEQNKEQTMTNVKKKSHRTILWKNKSI